MNALKRNRKVIIIPMAILALLLITTVIYAAEVVIDGFSQNSQTSLHQIAGDTPITLCEYRAPVSGTLGTHRDTCLNILGGDDDAFARFSVSAAPANQYMVLALDPSVTARAFAQWDGVDATENIDPIGLSSVDLTDTGLNDGIIVRIINSDGLPVDITISLYTNGANWAQRTIRLETSVSAGQVVDLFYPFADFSDVAGTMNPASIGAVEIELDATIQAGADLTVKLVKATSLWDFGDLPSPYATTLGDDGARHRATTGLRLGNNIDTEANGVPQTSATGDDTSYVIGTADDEDGVVRMPGLDGGGGWTNGTVALGEGGRLDVTFTGGTGVPQVFMDFDGLGLVPVTLRNSSGTALTMPLPAGTHQVYFDIPAGTFDGTNNRSIPTRVRLSSAGGLSATGVAPDGEVGDYIYNFGPTAVALQSAHTATNSPAAAFGFVAVLLVAVVSTGVTLYRRQRQAR